jgi:hypothetical protein
VGREEKWRALSKTEDSCWSGNKDVVEILWCPQWPMSCWAPVLGRTSSDFVSHVLKGDKKQHGFAIYKANHAVLHLVSFVFPCPLFGCFQRRDVIPDHTTLVHRTQNT